MIRFCITLLAMVALINSSPVEKKRPVVVDVPAVIFDEKPEASEIEKAKETSPVVETIDPGSVEVIQPKRPESFDSSVSVEEAEIPDRNTDFFGFRLPPMFIYRRPVIRDPFISSFPSFSSFSRPQQPVENSPSSFNMMSHMEKMMQRMQQQMSSLWGALLSPQPSNNRPFRPSFLDSDESKDNETAINFDNLPANYKNSTSETKVIDGQLVTVNKTVHRISSNNSNGFFQVQVINIRPQGPFKSRTTTEKPLVSEALPTTSEEKVIVPEKVEQTEQTTSPTAEDPSLNELDAFNDLEKVEESKGKIGSPGGSQQYGYDTSEEIEANPDVEVEFVPLEDIKKMNSRPRKTRKPDLSNDLKVNKWAEARLQNSGNLRMLDDDVEIIDV